MKPEWKVLTKTKRIKRGNYTYSLMDDYIHINNHKTNGKSIIVPREAIEELLTINIKEQAYIKLNKNFPLHLKYFWFRGVRICKEDFKEIENAL